jgi:CPA2 family monovalent cation:H+ antiporter-2
MVAAGSGFAGLFLELGCILLGVALLGRLATRWGLPSVPLYLVAGLVIGDGGVVPIVPARDFIQIGAEIGVILLLLLLGLEYSGDELTDALRTGLPAGGVDLALNFTPGLLVGVLLGWDIRAALLLGGITYISSSGIIAKLLSDLGSLGNRETPVVLAILVTEDLVMALYLPLMAGLLIGGSALTIGLEIGVALAVVAAALGAAVFLGHGLSRLVFSQSNEHLLLTLLGLALLMAGLAEQVQASAAVGAFLVGIALSGPAEHAARQLLTPLKDVFAALFFVFFGLQIDPGTLPPMLAIAAALAVVTAATKVATGWWSAARSGVSRPGRLRAGFTLIARGEFSIVIAGIAVAEGIEADIGPLAASYVLMLAIGGPLAAKAADPLSRRLGPGGTARRRVDSPAGVSPGPGGVPSDG